MPSTVVATGAAFPPPSGAAFIPLVQYAQGGDESAPSRTPLRPSLGNGSRNGLASARGGFRPPQTILQVSGFPGL